jgi:hypothetical protein
MRAASCVETSTMPEAPATARTPERSTSFASASSAAWSFTETSFGRWRATCEASTSTFEPAASASTEKRPGNASTTRSTFWPIEPVEPRIARPFMESWGGALLSRLARS